MPGLAGENRQTERQSRHPPQQPPTSPSGCCGSYCSPGWASPSQAEKIMHLVQLGKPRHSSLGQTIRRTGFLPPNLGALSPPDMPPPPLGILQPQPQARGWVLVRARRLCPSALMLPPLLWPPNLPEAPLAPSPPVTRPGPLRTTQPVLKMGPHPCLGPLIRNGWGAASWERKGVEGDREGQREALPRHNLPTCPPPAQRPQSRTSAADSAAGGWPGEGTPHSPEPGSLLQSPGGQPRPELSGRGEQSCQETGTE